MAYSIGIGRSKNGARHHCFSRERDRLAGIAQAIRYELFPDLDVMSNTSCRTASAHVEDMKENQLCLFCALQLPRPDSEQWFVRRRLSGLSIPPAAPFNFATSVTPGLCVKNGRP
jgi:hypothetical protein